MNTNEQIRAARARQLARAEARRRRQLPIRAIDQLISSLEELHLEGRKRVPGAFEERLEELNAILPADLRRELRPRVTIGHLMDDLYDIQHRLMPRPSPAADAEGLDDDEDWSQAS